MCVDQTLLHNIKFLGICLCLVVTVTGVMVTAEPASKPLIVTTKIEYPYVLPTRTHPAGVDELTIPENNRFEGFLVDLLDRLARHANFTYDIREVHDNQYGLFWFHPSSHHAGWTGMIGELDRGEADLALGATMITENRMTVVDFSEPFLDVKLRILIKKPLNPDQAVPFNDFEGLAHQTRIPYGVIEASATRMFFHNNSVEPYKTMGAYLNAHPENLARDYEEAMDRVRNGSYAFIVGKNLADYVTARPPCDITSVGEALPTDSKGYGIALQKNSPWTEPLSALIKQWKNDGTIQELYNKWWYEDTSCKM